MTDYISPEAQAIQNAAIAQNNVAESRKKMWNNVIFVVNYPILVAILYALSVVGLLAITPAAAGTTAIWLTCAVVGLLFMVFRKISNFIFGVFVLFTCCTGLIFLPLFNILVGYTSLLVISWVIPGMLQIPSLLFGILAGLAIGIGQIPSIETVTIPALKSIADQMKEKKNS